MKNQFCRNHSVRVCSFDNLQRMLARIDSTTVSKSRAADPKFWLVAMKESTSLSSQSVAKDAVSCCTMFPRRRASSPILKVEC